MRVNMRDPFSPWGRRIGIITHVHASSNRSDCRAYGTFRYARQEAVYYTLLMSTGLTFGTISALFG